MCNTISTPIRAPRCLGSAATSRRVSLALSKSSRYKSSRLPKCQRAELVGQGEDDVEVGNGQEVGLTFGQPGRPLAPTALRTASVAAGMIVVAHLAAVIALGDVPAQRRRAAERQVPKRLPHMGALGPTLQELGSILPHELTQGQWLVDGPCGGGRRSSGLTTCRTPAKVTCVYRAVVPMR